MKIGILSYQSENKAPHKEELSLQKEARELGHTSRILRARKFKMVFDGSSPWLFYDGKPFQHFDVMLARPSVVKDVDLNASIVEQMQLSGMLVLNGFDSILKAKNKLKTSQILTNYGIPMPKTVVVRRSEDLAGAVKLLGGFPVILKTPVGSYGNGVTIVESMRALKSVIVWNKPLYLLQQFVKFSRGRDIRIFVVNGRVVASMMRSAQKGEFRSNIELGGKGGAVKITEEEASIAIRAVQALDLHYGGVDLIRSKEGPFILEVNSNPGFKSLEKASGVNVAKAIVEYAVELAERRI